MKPRSYTAFLLFISAYSPLFIILGVKDFDFENTVFKHPIGIYILLGLSFLSTILLLVSINTLNKGSLLVEVSSVKNRSIDLINYTIPYIVSFFGFDLSKTEDVVSLALFMSLMFLLTVKSKSIFMNPILLLLGFNLFEIEYTHNNIIKSTTVISKFDIKVNEQFTLKRITRFLYFANK